MVYKAQLAKKEGQGESSTPAFVAVKILKGIGIAERAGSLSTQQKR